MKAHLFLQITSTCCCEGGGGGGPSFLVPVGFFTSGGGGGNDEAHREGIGIGWVSVSGDCEWPLMCSELPLSAEADFGFVGMLMLGNRRKCRPRAPRMHESGGSLRRGRQQLNHGRRVSARARKNVGGELN
jgi:hypothetical protein